jgi:hypothetical protein
VQKADFCAGYISSPLPVCAQGGELSASGVGHEALPAILRQWKARVWDEVRGGGLLLSPVPNSVQGVPGLMRNSDSFGARLPG